MDGNQMDQIKTGINVGLVVVTLFVALYLATRFGFIHCSFLPHWCGIYAKINTAISGHVYPSIAILYGDKGMGDPKWVETYIRRVCGYRHVTRIPIGYISLGNLESYDVVIVEHARYLTASQMEMLWDFVTKGGRLVIVGDVGVEGPKDEILTWEDLGERNRAGVVNMWDRKKEDGTIIQFGSYLLGLKYIGISGEENSYSGTVHVSQDITTSGLPRSLDLKTQFVATRVEGASILGPQVVPAVIDETAEVNGEKPPFPAIVRIGYRLVYLAYPPEMAGKDHVVIYYNLCKVVT